MGQDVDNTTFDRNDRQMYRKKLHTCLEVFARMLGEARFDFEHPMTGLEIELNLIDGEQNPAMRNAEVLDAIANDDFQTELAQFNIEINVRAADARRHIAGRRWRPSFGPASTTPRSARGRPERTSR